jgi:hypothetical protein
MSARGLWPVISSRRMHIRRLLVIPGIGRWIWRCKRRFQGGVGRGRGRYRVQRAAVLVEEGGVEGVVVEEEEVHGQRGSGLQALALILPSQNYVIP